MRHNLFIFIKKLRQKLRIYNLKKSGELLKANVFLITKLINKKNPLFL